MDYYMPKTTNRTNDWITPRSLIEALGPFDLDPCGSQAQPWATAARQFTIVEDGLIQPWEGRVWLNPPYSKPRPWMEKMARHGRGTAIIFARTDTAWFHDHVFSEASGIFYLRGRVRFYQSDGTIGYTNGGAASVLVS